MTISIIQALSYHQLIDLKIFNQSLYYQRVQLVIPILHLLILSVIYIGLTISYPITNSLVYILEGGLLVGFVYLPLRIISYRSAEPISTHVNRSENEEKNNSENDSNRDLRLKNNMMFDVLQYRRE